MTGRAEKKRWPPSGFGGRLQQLRERAGLTQAELAERAGCFPLTVSKLERGVQEPAWPLVVALARALGVSCDSFVVNDGDQMGEKPRPRGRPKRTVTAPPEQRSGKGAGHRRKRSGTRGPRNKDHG
jgi:transcriptional regulator with XRE-family HTH domain